MEASGITRTAGRDLSMSVGGTMDNSATVSAGRDLTITAASLTNQASGELLAGRNNTINVTNGLTNWGLIDGGATNINAGRVDNFGRIYGNTIAIRAGELVNGAGPGGGAVIASRGDLDLGVGSLVNRDHALIYAGADLRIGGRDRGVPGCLDRGRRVQQRHGLADGFAVGVQRKKKVFFDRENDVLAPKSVQKLLSDESFLRAIDKALYGYLGGVK